MGKRVEDVVAELRAYVVELSENELALDDVDPAGHLFDFGYISSLTAVMFVAHLEEQYGVTIEDLDLVESYTTLAAVAAHVAERA